MPLYREDAVVLRTHKLGEADRIVVLMTAGRGKVRAVAKGVRRTKSRFGGRLEPGGQVNLLLYEGRDLDVVEQVETIAPNRRIREDLERMADCLALVEAVDQLTEERQPDRGLFKMLTGALGVLGAADARPPLLVGAFYWKLLAHEGVAPVLDGCVICGSPEIASFEPAEGGVLCRAHRRGSPVDQETVDLVRLVLGGGLGGALRHPDGPAVRAASHLATAMLESHLERRLRAAHLLREG